MNHRFLQSLAIIGVAALLGLSLAKVLFANTLAFSVGAVVIAAVAVGIAGLFRQQTASFEKTTSPHKLLGLRIGTAGFIVALCGWLIRVFLSPVVGYYIVALGVVAGFIGFPIHIYNMFRK